ncbi:MAG TPA: NAD+ synthase [Armatimonadota bacterium]|nr:NAD+ synthase [Armatimonadota bacterium]
MQDELSIACEAVRGILLEFISGFFAQAGCERAVIGLSGGLDSAVTALLTAQALGEGRLTCALMPCGELRADTRADAEEIVALAGAEQVVVDIAPQLDVYFRRFPGADRVRRGNKMARERMSILYDQSSALAALVVGTSNRTEWLLGYFTLWGDMGAALSPLAGLYKTQVRQLAHHLGVPQRIIDKPPTADLWRGQTDEAELGVTYDQADRILYRLLDLELSAHQVVAEGFSQTSVNRVLELMRGSEFKRRLPVTPDLGQAAPQDDFI